MTLGVVVSPSLPAVAAEAALSGNNGKRMMTKIVTDLQKNLRETQFLKSNGKHIIRPCHLAERNVIIRLNYCESIQHAKT
jgi:hypothetical protein